MPASFGGRIMVILQNYGMSFLRGAASSMLIALVGTAIGCVIGFAVGIIQTIPVEKKDSAVKKILLGILKFILNAYVEIFRGTPMMAQAMLIYYGSMALFNIHMYRNDPFPDHDRCDPASGSAKYYAADRQQPDHQYQRYLRTVHYRHS